MMADRLLFDAIPGLREAIPESLRGRLDAQRATPHAASIAVCRDLLRRWPFDRSTIHLALAPTIPLHCSDDFLAACRDLAPASGAGARSFEIRAPRRRDEFRGVRVPRGTSGPSARDIAHANTHGERAQAEEVRRVTRPACESPLYPRRHLPNH